MNRHASVVWGLIVLLGLAAPARRRAAAGPAKAAPAPATKPAPGVLRFKHLRVDLAKRCVIMQAEVCRQSSMLEFLVCREGTKEYESILRTKAPGQQLHAALLALGLTPGKPARWSGSGETARFLPPQGPGIEIMLRWKDKKGKIHRASAGQWLISAGQKKVAMPKEWIFIGSEIMPDGRYWADVDGEIISVANFASAVLDVPFESSDKNAQLDFEANARVVPPVKTPVEIILSPKAGAEKSPHARVLLEIDRFGRFRVAGRGILATDLEKWAQRYVTKHPRGQVHIRAAGRALVADVARARDELRVGGVDEIEVTRLVPEGAILPRTAAQADQELTWWAWKFQNAKDLIRDPGEQAEATLKQIAQDIQRLQATQTMWQSYASRLRKAMNEYKKASKSQAAESREP